MTKRCNKHDKNVEDRRRVIELHIVKFSMDYAGNNSRRRQVHKVGH